MSSHRSRPSSPWIHRRLVWKRVYGCAATAVLASALPPGAAVAQTQDSAGGELGIAVVFTDPDDARNADEGAGLRVSYTRPWTDRWRWEASFSHVTLDTGSEGGTDFYQTSAGFDFSYRFGTGRGWTPTVHMGAGFARNDVFPGNLDDLSPYVSAAAGFLSKPYGKSGVRVRGRIVFQYDDFGPGMNDGRLELGVSVPLGRRGIEETQELRP